MLHDIAVCDSCTVALVNADVSHIDDTETIERLESFGNMILVGDYPNGGYWDCDGCQEVVIGDGKMFQLI